jgi:hypothetical protein
MIVFPYVVPLLGSAWWPPILQTAIGAAGAIAGGFFGSWFTWQKERQSVAGAFAAEVQGIVDLIETRFRERFAKNIETMLMKGEAELQKEAAWSWTDYLQPT